MRPSRKSTRSYSRQRGAARARGGYSAIVTLIMVATTLVITVASTFVSFNVLEAQSEMAEYENAKAALTSMAQLIETLSQSEGLAGYSRMYVRSGCLDIGTGQECFTLRIGGWTALEALPFLTIGFRGGRFIGGPDYSVLRGQQGSYAQDFLIVPPSTPEIPLGWVYVEQEGGAKTLVDFGRVRISFIGTMNLTTASGGWESVNVVEIVFIRLLRGPTYGREVFDLRAQNKKIVVTTTRLLGTTFEILAVSGQSSQTYTLVCPATQNDKPVVGTIFNVVVVDIEVGTQ